MRIAGKQQKGYGKAEALLEIKWPERYNALGHLRWNGRLYGRGLVRALGVQPQRIYHGVWGSAPFQSLYEPAQGLLSAIPAMPEWYLIILLLIGLAGLDWFWSPELWVFPLMLTAIAISFSQAAWSAAHARFSFGPLSRWQRLRLYGLTTLLYCMQPLARLWGRLDNGLTPWRRRRLIRSLRLPLPQQRSLWSEQWHSAADWILAMVQEINHQGIIALYGDDFSAWDLEIRGGLMGSIQVLMAIEEHGAGKQLLRFRCWPKLAPLAVVTLGVLVGFTLFALWDQYLQSAIVLGTIALVLVAVMLWDWTVAMGTYLRALACLSKSPQIRG